MQKFIKITVAAVIFYFVFGFIDKAFISEPSVPEFETPIVTPHPVPSPPILPKATIAGAVQSITTPELKEFVEYLASDELAGRKPGTEGFTLAYNYVFHEFMSYGMQPCLSDKGFHQQFRYKGIMTSNIVGYFPGKNKDKVIVLGAHLDHLGSNSRGIYNGADDNASGIATLLEIAEAVSKIKDQLNYSIVFIAFSSEEDGLIGSEIYAKHPCFPHENTVAMLNFDMVGYLKNQSQLGTYGSGRNKTLTDILHRVDDKYSFTAKTSDTATSRSDHAHWARRGVPIIFFHTGDHPYYHTTKDTAEKVDYDGMTEVARFAFEVLMEIDKTMSARNTSS